MFLRKVLLVIAFFLLTVITAIVGAYFYVESQIKKPVEEVGFYRSFVISSGESAKQIGENLAKEGLIGDFFYFKFYLWKSGLKSSIKAGEYNLSSAMSIPEIVDILSKGKIVEQDIVVLIPEGLISAEIEEILAGKELLEKGQLIKAVLEKNLNRYYKYDFLLDKPKDANLEGYLFPDTYNFYKKTTPEEILEKILNNFDKKVDLEMREEIARQGKTIFEVLTLASIVQEEANGAGDMKIVAGIFQNRLDIGKPLESDATINFVSGKKMRQPLFSDLEISSPYNTYKNIGLPPGPIDNPGIDAMRAVIWPEKSSYLYFLHTPDGKAVYGRTYEDHLRNRVKYLD
ncbi:MAG: endolytic transglycosylase MltG [Patescibacteria group bacterium]